MYSGVVVMIDVVALALCAGVLVGLVVSPLSVRTTKNTVQ